MSVCLSVCSLCISTPYEQMQPNFAGYTLSSRGRSTTTFYQRKIDPPPAKGRTMYLTNEIAAFGSIGEVLNSTP